MAVGSIVGAVVGNKGAKKAANAQVQAAQIGANEVRAGRELSYNTLNPFVQAGAPATQTINALLGLGGDTAAANNSFRNFLDNSNYAFDLGEGLSAVNAGYAGQGAVKSGAAMRGIEDYRNNLQNSYRGQYLGALGNQQQLGLSAGSAIAGVSQNSANSLAQLAQNAGDARANAALVKAQNTSNAVQSGINSLAKLIGGF